MSSSQSMAHDEAMHRYEEQYDALKAKLQAVGFIGQGSVQTRRIACGSPTCRCHHDPDARHGPYHYPGLFVKVLILGETQGPPCGTNVVYTNV